MGVEFVFAVEYWGCFGIDLARDEQDARAEVVGGGGAG